MIISLKSFDLVVLTSNQISESSPFVDFFNSIQELCTVREQGLNGVDMPPAAVRQLFSRDAPEQIHHAAGGGLAEEPGEVLCGRFGDFAAAGE